MSEQVMFEQIMDTLPDPILFFDKSWRVTYANQAARRLLPSHTGPLHTGPPHTGLLQPEHLNRETLWELFPETAGTSLEQAFHEVAATHTQRTVHAFFSPTLQACFDISLVPFKDGVAANYRDVTSLHDAISAHEVIADKLNRALDTTTDSIVSIGRDWRITYMNKRAMLVTAPSGDVLGKILWECFPAVLEPGSPYLEHYRLAMNEQVESQFEAFYPEPLNVWVQITAQPAPDGIILFFRDVTLQKRAAAALMQSEKLAAVGRLASSIAHEINNPLESVTNLLYLAHQYNHDPDVQGFLDLAEQELRRVSSITNQTLRFHRQATKPQATSCSNLFASVLSLYEGRLKNSNIVVSKRKRANQPVECFEGDIRQVLSNLVGNAIDSMPAGGNLFVRSHNQTDWRTGRPGIVLTIADNGCGMDPRTQARIFEAFFTTKGNGGTGLGLWISAEIIDRHKGRLRIRSSQNPNHKGTVVTLFLPFVKTSDRPVSIASL